MHHTFRIGLAAVIPIAALVVGCGESATPDENGYGSGSAALRAASGTDDDSTAPNLTTPEGIIGTVGLLKWSTGTIEASCSGTLVTRKMFLTASHCVVKGNGIRPGTAQVRFPQQSNRWFEVDEPGIRYLNDLAPQLYEAGQTFGTDLAIVPLLEEVPSSIVQHVAPVFTGDLEQAAFSRKPTLFDAIQVGLGYDQNGVIGNRKWGYLSTLRPAKKSISYRIDNLIGYDTFRTFADVRLVADWDESTNHDGGRLESNTDQGDSGGPVFMKYQGTYMVVGVVSGHEDLGVFNKQVKAFTGSLYGLNNGAWLTPFLGDDADSDGVPDSADNCPPSRCAAKGLPLQSCSNLSQKDADFDGIGDACDNCPQSICDTLLARNPTVAALFTCSNKDQVDTDRDGIGDVCDLCPNRANSNGYLDDADNDLVGDACDTICSSYEPYPKCGKGLPCARGSCLVPPGAEYGHCTDFPDDDRDGVPNHCDNCPKVQTTNILNSNRLAEKQYREDQSHAFRPEYRGDLCDSVPVFKIDKPVAAAVYKDELSLLEGDRNPYEVETIAGATWIGCDPDSGACDPTKPATGNLWLESGVSFRFCSCFDRKIKLEAAKCEEQCDASKWQDSSGKWSDITVTTASWTSVTPGSPDRRGFFDRKEEKAEYLWSFHKDTLAGVVPSVENDLGVREVHGFVGSNAGRSSLVRGQDQDSMGDLRTVAELFSLPNVVVKDRSHGLVSGCFAPACLRFVRPSGIERIRWPDTVEIFSSIKDAAVIVSREGNFSLHLSGRDGFDVKAEIVPELAKVIEAQEMWAWIPPAESGSRLAALGLETQAAVVPREGFGLTSPALVALQEDRLFMPLRPPEISVPGSSVATELASVVLPKSGRAVFSAARNEIYIAGGSFRGEPIGGIRVYDFASDGWTRLRTEATFGDRVLALALDAARDRLFVLDVGTSETARLTVVELQTENSAVLWEVPFKERFDRSSLGVDDEGNLVLVGTRGKDVTAWRFAVDEKEQVSWLGRYEAYEIEMLDEIVFRGDVLAIPVASGNSFRFLDLVPAVFERNDSKIDEL